MCPQPSPVKGKRIKEVKLVFIDKNLLWREEKAKKIKSKK